MTPNKTFTILAYCSILPFIFALFLALYSALDGPAISGYFINFARINSYIYAHSYGALLLALFAGVQIGMNLQNQSQNRGYVLFNFFLMALAWLSYHSFADATGMILLLSCWVAALFIDYIHQQQASGWYGKLKLKLNSVVIILLLLLLIINR